MLPFVRSNVCCPLVVLSACRWPYIRPELLSGRMYREREKLAAKVQAGIKGASAGAVAAEKEAKLKKKK